MAADPGSTHVNSVRGLVRQLGRGRRLPVPCTPTLPAPALVSALTVYPALALALAMILPTLATAARWDWSGSIAVDQKLLDMANPGEDTNSGSIVEWAMKTTVEVSRDVTANVKLCTSCHGITVDQAYAEIRFHPLINLEGGRINVPFGDYYLRHDPASDALPSKPLPYAMGQMVRFRADQFNLGVLPMPYSDQGASLFGDVWIRDSFQAWYALYLVNGFRSSSPRDFNFKNQVSDGGFVDNNNEPSWGARVSLAQGRVSLGGSILQGSYDPRGNYDYEVWGLDAAALVADIQLRAEYLERDTDVQADGERATLTKKGFYVQAEAPLGRYLRLVGRFDGLLREGPPLGTENDKSSGIGRWTVGVNIAPSIDYAFRLDYEYWRFTDFTDVRAAHLGIVVSY